MSAQAALAAIRPTGRELVYDLVRAVGLNVDDWSNYKKGKTAPAANPRYCYEWSFTQDDQYVVLNLWHASFMAHGEALVCDLNMCQYALEIARARNEPWRDNKPQAVWATRATKMDLAIQLAVRKKLPIRVIVCEGTMRDFAAGDEKSSKFKIEPWILKLGRSRAMTPKQGQPDWFAVQGMPRPNLRRRIQTSL